MTINIDGLNSDKLLIIKPLIINITLISYFSEIRNNKRGKISPEDKSSITDTIKTILPEFSVFINNYETGIIFKSNLTKYFNIKKEFKYSTRDDIYLSETVHNFIFRNN